MDGKSASASPTDPSTPAVTQWLARVASVQRDKATPEQMELMKRRSDASRRSDIQARKAARMSRSLTLSSTIWRSGLQDVQEHADTPGADASPAYRGQSMRRAATIASDAMGALSSPQFLSPSPAVTMTHGGQGSEDAAARLLHDLRSEEVLEEQATRSLDALVAQQVAAGTLSTLDAASANAALSVDAAGQEAAARDEAAALEAALSQLEREPADEAECEAKFKLYEGYAKLTEDARNATLEWWDGVTGEFAEAPAVRRQCEREIQAIDKEANLGIHEGDRRWFAHGMCKAAACNQKQIKAVLAKVTGKLELLTSQEECPICFDPLSDKPTTTLSCAHKTCSDCWGNWVAVAGGHSACCPLCRHQEFFERVLHAAGQADA